MTSGSEWVDKSLEKKSRPSFEGWVSAKSRDEIVCRTGEVDPCVTVVELRASSEVEV